MSEVEVKTIQKVLAVYSIILVILGTIGNALTCLVCLKKKLRCITTFILIAFMAISETASIYIWNVDHFILPFFGFEIEYLNIYSCKISVFIQFFSLECSAWLLVSLKYYYQKICVLNQLY